MDNKIQELAQSIYREGVEKAEIESKRILSEAEQQSARIIEKAEKEAQSILAEANKKAQDLKMNADSEIQLAARQAVAGLKQKITDLILFSAVDTPVKSLLTDPHALKDLLTVMLQSFSAGSANPNLEILLPQTKQKELDGMLSNTLKELLSKGVEIRFTDTFQAGFQIAPKGGAFKISFTDSDFSEFLKSYLKPKTREILFGK
jgi:V/A-type H+-transporting ATPase subunit E